MSPEPVQLPPVVRPPVRGPFLATILSLLLPGVGHLYVGMVRAAAVLLAAHLLLPPLVALAWGAGLFSLRAWWLLDRSLGLVLRVLAAVLAVVATVRTRERPLPLVPMGVYGVFIIGWIVVSVLAGTQLQRWVPSPVELSAPAAGLEAGEYVQATKVGAAARPRPGAWALYVVDVPDAMVSPAAPTKRDAFLGRVVGLGPTGFQVEGRDAEVPFDDFVGEPAGVVLSAADGGVRWDRLGVAPR